MIFLEAFNIVIICLNIWAIGTGVQCWSALYKIDKNLEELKITQIFTLWGIGHFGIVFWWCVKSAWEYPPLYLEGHIMVSLLFGLLSYGVVRFHKMTLRRAIESRFKISNFYPLYTSNIQLSDQ